MAFADNDALEMAGEWKLTYGLEVGLGRDSTGHFVPLQPRPTFKVHFDPGVDFDPGVPNANGKRYKGNYLPEDPHDPLHPQPPHHLGLDERGALVAETLYDHRGVIVVRLIEHAEQYFALLSGHHQHYISNPSDPTRVEIVGGWCDVGSAGPDQNTNSNKGNFTLVKISA